MIRCRLVYGLIGQMRLDKTVCYRLTKYKEKTRILRPLLKSIHSSFLVNPEPIHRVCNRNTMWRGCWSIASHSAHTHSHHIKSTYYDVLVGGRNLGKSIWPQGEHAKPHTDNSLSLGSQQGPWSCEPAILPAVPSWWPTEEHLHRSSVRKHWYQYHDNLLLLVHMKKMHWHQHIIPCNTMYCKSSVCCHSKEQSTEYDHDQYVHNLMINYQKQSRLQSLHCKKNIQKVLQNLPTIPATWLNLLAFKEYV